MRGKPRVVTACVANRYTGPEKRIIEFSFNDGTGGLISFKQPRGKRPGRVEVYRTDGQVTVVAPREEVQRQAAVDDESNVSAVGLPD